MIINTSGGARVLVSVPERVAVDTPLSAARSDLTAATDGNGIIRFAGGFGGAHSAVVDKYALDGTRTTDTALSTARSYLAAATDGNGIIRFGGGEATTAYSSVVDKYALNGTRTTDTALSAARGYLAAATDGNGIMRFGGGMTATASSAVVDKYALAGTRTTDTALSAARGYLAAATDGNGNVLFGGGMPASGSVSWLVDKYALDGTYSLVAPLSIARFGIAAATDGNGNVLFGGGSIRLSGISEDCDAVDKYAPNGARTTNAPLSIGRAGIAAVTDGNGNVLFAGGSFVPGGGGYYTYVAAVDKYALDGTRTTGTALSAARSDLAAATDGNGIIRFGGGRGTGYSNVVDKRALFGSIEITVPAFNAYRFREHSEEQPPFDKDTQIIIQFPNSGYFRQTSGEITL